MSKRLAAGVYFKLGADPSGLRKTRRVCPQLEIHPAAGKSLENLLPEVYNMSKSHTTNR